MENDFRNGFFQHIGHRFESSIEFLGPVYANLHQNAFDVAAGSNDVWGCPDDALINGEKLYS